MILKLSMSTSVAAVHPKLVLQARERFGVGITVGRLFNKLIGKTSERGMLFVISRWCICLNPLADVPGRMALRQRRPLAVRYPEHMCALLSGGPSRTFPELHLLAIPFEGLDVFRPRNTLQPGYVHDGCGNRAR